LTFSSGMQFGAPRFEERGAAPRGAFVNVNVSNVDRSVKRAFAGVTGKSPVTWPHIKRAAPGRRTGTMDAVSAIVAQRLRETDAIEKPLESFCGRTSQKRVEKIDSSLQAS
jgi:hypothetical protein